MEQGKIGFVNRINLFPSREWLDERAFEALFLEYYARVHAVLFRLVGDRDEADDLASETFWKLWESPPARNENIAGWLYRVATRLGYNALRASHRRFQYENLVGRFNLEQGSADSPETEAEKHQELMRVRQTLRQMPLREVQLLVLRHSGLSYKEIAAAVHIPLTSVGKLLTRAEEKFVHHYRKGDPDAPQR